LALSGVAASGCGGPSEGAQSPANAQEEEKAQHLLERARQSHDAAHYRRLVLRFGNTQAAEDGKDELAGILLEQAKKAMADEDWSTAHDRAEEARMYAALERTREARAVVLEIDEKRAAQVAKSAKKQAGQGKCASALKAVASPLRQKPSDHFKETLQKLAKDTLLSCMEAKMGEDVKAGNVDAARGLLNSPDATTALSNDGFADAEKRLRKLIVGQSTQEIRPLLDQRKWKEAIAKLDELEANGKLSKAERPLADEIVRDALQKHLLSLAKEGLTAKKPSAALAEFDAQLALGKWKSVPDSIVAAKKLLAIAVECEKRRCKMGAPKAQWAWGAVGVAPPANAEGEAVATVEHGHKLWLLASGPGPVLVATKDPGAASGGALFAKAGGWVDKKLLRSTETRNWLPPTEQLEGFRVWAPLRPPDKALHLGTVTKVNGRKVTVKRVADDAEITVDVKTLHAGTLDEGVKVMAFCADQVHTEVARIQSVVSEDAGKPKVKIACEKGDITRVEVAGALTTKPEWLPKK
jgi:hypothetical protein